MYPIDANLTEVDVPERVEVLLVSPSYFSVLGRAPAARTHLRRRRQSPGNCRSRRDQRCAVAAAVRRRSRRARPQAAHRRRSLHDRGRDAAGLPSSRPLAAHRRRNVGAVGLQRRAVPRPGARIAYFLSGRHRPIEAGHVARGSAAADGRLRAPAPRRVPGRLSRPRRMDAADHHAAAGRGRQRPHAAADDARRRRDRAAHRVREHRRAAPGARVGAPARARRAARDGIGPRPSRAPAADREPAALAERRGRRPAAGGVGRRSAPEPRADGSAADVGSRDQRPRAGLHLRRVDRHRHSLRARAGGAILQPGRPHGPEGRPVARGGVAPRAAVRARDRRVRARDGAARRRRAARAQLLASPERGRRIRRPQRTHRARVAAAAERPEGREVLHVTPRGSRSSTRSCGASARCRGSSRPQPSRTCRSTDSAGAPRSQSTAGTPKPQVRFRPSRRIWPPPITSS